MNGGNVSRIRGWDVSEETVDELLATARTFLHSEQRRAESLNARGSGLAAFVGVIVSIAAVAGAAGVSAEPSTSPERTVVSAVLGAALLVLMSAIVLVVWHVLRPADGYVVDLDEISRYPTFEYVSRRKVRVQGELLRDHVDAVDRDRRRNDQKTQWLGRAYALVCLGLALVTATGVGVTIGHYAT